ncbi:MAG TPA: flagellar motor protein MotB [Clostridia bacterium]|nr:flagellar motor protein MotB [Clostridia bacterium]
MSDKKNEESGGAPEWMVTYGDLVTLLMCFFVLLFAFSEIDAQKFEAVMQSFQGSAGVLSGGTTLSDSPLVFTGMPETNTSNETTDSQVLDDLKKEIESQLDDANIELEITAEVINRGLLIRFPDNALFDSGEASLKDPARDALEVIGNILLDDPFTERVISVEGHTDNVPMSSAEFPSNWELSTTRATNVIRYFLDEVGIVPKRLSASGYGEYYPIATNETPEGRSQNRRVDIVVMREFFTTRQPETDEGE